MKKQNSKKRKVLDIMFDLECLDAKSNNPVLTQISAVPFNIETGKIFNDSFNEFVSPKSCLSYGLTLHSDTCAWWFNQDLSVINSVLVKAINEGKDLKLVLTTLATWLIALKKLHNADELRVYGNGLLADIKWLESAFMACGVEVPWKYFEPVDVRTLVDLGKRLFDFDPKKTIKFEGDKHNAIDDCKFQIKYCSAIYKKAKK